MGVRTALIVSTGIFAATAGAPAIHARTNAIYEIKFRAPGSDGTALHVCLRAEDGRFAAGVTVGPLGPTEVDCTALTLSGNAIGGSLKASVGFDGYYPKDGKTVFHEYRLNATVSGQTLIGTYEGTVTPGDKVAGSLEGTAAAPPDLSGYRVMDLQMENARGTGVLGQKSYGERVYPKLFLKDGLFVQNLIYGWGGRVQINYFESAIVTNALRFDGRTVTGSLTVKPTSGPMYVYTFDGTVVGERIGGLFRKQVDGKEEAGGPFHGKLQAVPARPLDRSLYYLELHHAVLRTWVPTPAADARLQLMTFAPCVAGKFGSAMAYAAAWNHTYHDVDASGLRVNGTALTGGLRVTMNPDPYMPPDRKTVPAVYSLTAHVVDGRIIQGTYTGTFKDMAVSGPVFGELLDQPPVPEPVSIHGKLEDGVNGGAPWFRRVFFGFTAVNGASDRGSISNNKGGWKGTFRKAQVTFDGAVFKAEIEGSVDESNGPEKGVYAFKLTGRVIGSELVGTCDTHRDGKLTKTGTPFMGGFKPVQHP